MTAPGPVRYGASSEGSSDDAAGTGVGRGRRHGRGVELGSSRPGRGRIDLPDSDVVVGTSAGAAVGAQVTSGTSLDELYQRQLAVSVTEKAARISLLTILRWTAAGIGAKTPEVARTRIGRMALKARTGGEAERRDIIESRLMVADWPQRRLVITAVATDDGEYVTFDRDSGVSLLDAIGASCAVPGVWPPVTIKGRRYMDGGVRSVANADAATGCDPVVVIAPITRAFTPAGAPAAQLASYPAGTRTLLIAPDRAALTAIGRNVLDPARSGAAAQAGRRQAGDLVTAVKAIWV